MATLYDVDVRTINEHIKKIYSDSELEEDSTIRNFRIVQTEGSRQVTRDTKHYSLQMIIAVGFKVNSERSRMYNDYDGIQHDYTRKHGLIYQEVMLPPMAPSEWNDREQLWNAVEETEKTKDSRLAREFVVALPVELDKDSNISLLQDFIKKNFVNMGMCADFAIHDNLIHISTSCTHIIMRVCIKQSTNSRIAEY